MAKKANVVESAERDLIFLSGVELSVLHIWNVWAGVVTFLLHSHGGVIVHKGAEPILRVWENQLRDPDVLLLCGWQSIQASVLFQVEKGQSTIIGYKSKSFRTIHNPRKAKTKKYLPHNKNQSPIVKNDVNINIHALSQTMRNAEKIEHERFQQSRQCQEFSLCL